MSYIYIPSNGASRQAASHDDESFDGRGFVERHQRPVRRQLKAVASRAYTSAEGAMSAKTRHSPSAQGEWLLLILLFVLLAVVLIEVASR